MIDRRGRRALVAVMTAALAWSTTAGCSVVFLTPPPPTEERGAIVHCTSSDALPLVDLLVAGVQLLRVLLALQASEADYDHATIGRTPDILIGTSTLVGFAASSGYGFSQASKCREMLAQDYDPDPRPPRGRRPPTRRTVGPPAPAPAPPEKREAEAARADGGSPREPDAAPAPAVVVPDAPAQPRAPAVPQRQDTE